MKKKAFRLSDWHWFLLLFGSIFLAAEVYSLVERQQQCRQIGQLIDQQRGKQVLFFGGSHVAFGIREQSVRVGNVAARSEPYVFVLKKMQLLQPEVAVISLSPQNLQSSMENVFADGLLNLPQYQFLFGQLSGEQQGDVLARMDFETKAFFRAKTVIPFLGSRLRTEPDTLLLGRWEDWDTISRANDFQIRQRFREEFAAHHFRQSPVQWKYVRKIVAFARQHNIRVVFLACPLHPQFARQIPERLFTEIEHWISGLQARSFPVEYYNYSHYSLPKNCFYDSDHLNGKGAAVFTKIVMDRLRKDGYLDE